jgi:hypothetical protein
MRIETLTTLAIFVAILGLISLVFAGVGDNSDGIRQGELIKLSNRGWVWKTWEAELSMGAITSQGDSMAPYVFDFSVCDRDPTKIAILNNAIGKQVKIIYVSPMVFPKWNQKTPYCVTSVEIVQ